MTKIPKDINKIPLIRKEIKMQKPLSVDETLNALTNKFLKRAEFELTDTGYFRDITETIENELPSFRLGTLGLRITHLSPEKDVPRRLEIIAKNETNHYQTTRLLAEGKREDIINVLKSKDFTENFKQKLYDISTDFLLEGL